MADQTTIDPIIQVIENLRLAGKSDEVVYPYAYGFIFAHLTPEQIKVILARTQEILAESKNTENTER